MWLRDFKYFQVKNDYWLVISKINRLKEDWQNKKNITQELNNKKNAKEVVEDYVNKTLNAFPNAKILFMEPLPQFIIFIQNGIF